MESGSEKYNLSDCSIVIPVQIDSTERLEHIHFFYEYVKRNFINYRLIIIEQSSKQQIHLPTDSQIQIEFFKKEAPFSVSEICNIGASFVKTPFFCRCDADSLIHPKAIFDAFELLKNQSSQSFVFPFNGIVFDVTDTLRKKILQFFEWPDLPFFTNEQLKTVSIPNIHLHNPNAFGLIHHFRTDIFKKLGGYNEEFIGWGYEDNEIVHRFQILGHPRVHLENYNGFHFVHPRNQMDGAQVFKNFCRMQVVKDSSPEELLGTIGRWNRFC